MQIDGKITNGGIIPILPNEKSVEELYYERCQKVRNLRRALNKIIELCDREKMQDKSEIWMQQIGFAKETLKEI